MTCNVGLKWPSLQGAASLKSPVLALLSTVFCLWLSSLSTLLGTGFSPRPAAQHCPEVLLIALLRQADQLLGQDAGSAWARKASINSLSWPVSSWPLPGCAVAPGAAVWSSCLPSWLPFNWLRSRELSPVSGMSFTHSNLSLLVDIRPVLVCPPPTRTETCSCSMNLLLSL